MRTFCHFCAIAALSAVTLAAQDAPGAQGTSLDTQPPIPVFARFVRMSMTGTFSSSTVTREDPITGQVGTGMTSVQGERLYDSNELASPVRGVVLVEVPLSALKFTTDGNKYVARARVTATVYDGNGKAAWSQSKESVIRGPESKLAQRRQGSLYFVRSLTLPGGSAYTVEAKVEDLQAQNSGTIQNPVKPGAGAPGLHASDAFFVRKYDGSLDKTEADQVFSFEGNAFSPVLDPVFPAGRAFGMQMFFVLYPDQKAGQPQMTFELMRDGQVAAKGTLPFKHKLFDLAMDPGGNAKGGSIGQSAGTAPMGAQAHEYPYLADLKLTQLPAGDYEAVITIQQHDSTITRTVPFKVAGTPPPAPTSK